MNVFGMGPLELILILVIALVVFGPGRLPEVGSAIGRGIREFRKATLDVQEGITREIQVPITQATTEDAEPDNKTNDKEQPPATDAGGEEPKPREESRD